jgi:hypothetical protein
LGSMRNSGIGKDSRQAAVSFVSNGCQTTPPNPPF